MIFKVYINNQPRNKSKNHFSEGKTPLGLTFNFDGYKPEVIVMNTNSPSFDFFGMTTREWFEADLNDPVVFNFIFPPKVEASYRDFERYVAHRKKKNN